MPARHLPVRPDLHQLRQQAKDLLRAIRANDSAAVADLVEFHPQRLQPADARLGDAQLALARSYGVASWPRLVSACRMTDAIWRGDAPTVRRQILADPKLLTEDARGVDGNWGPPMSYAANVGDTAIVEMLAGMGAADLQHAFQRACLQGKLTTARRLFDLGARPLAGEVMGSCETLNARGLKFLLDLNADLADHDGNPLAPVAMVLETYSRYPDGKHECLELMAAHGIELPDTPPMAVHRGRIDLLVEHLRRDPSLLQRTFEHAEIYPPTLGCNSDESLALHGAPLAGGTLLHLCVDFDEAEIVRWLLAQNMAVDQPAAIDADGFGGHTALYGCVVSQPYRCGRQQDGSMGRLLLNRGASPSLRASLRKRLRFADDETVHEYVNVTPVDWGRQFHNQAWVCMPVMRMLASLETQP